jgi:hypothetical protein
MTGLCFESCYDNAGAERVFCDSPQARTLPLDTHVVNRNHLVHQPLGYKEKPQSSGDCPGVYDLAAKLFDDMQQANSGTIAMIYAIFIPLSE